MYKAMIVDDEQWVVVNLRNSWIGRSSGFG